jgi:hypothetical protein
VNRSRLATVLLAGLVLLAGSTLGSYAANGGPLLLGKGNTASKTTTLKTTGNGAALKLRTKKTAPPLKVNGTGKVAKLNADQLDGKDSEALETTSYSYALTASGTGSSTKFTFPGVPDGRYLVSFNVGAAITGSETEFYCYFYPDGAGGDGVSHVVGLGTQRTGSGNWYLSASGELDTSIPDTYALYCETDGTTLTIPPTNEVESEVVFTRIDNIITDTRTGGPLS